MTMAGNMKFQNPVFLIEAGKWMNLHMRGLRICRSILIVTKKFTYKQNLKQLRNIPF